MKIATYHSMLVRFTHRIHKKIVVPLHRVMASCRFIAINTARSGGHFPRSHRIQYYRFHLIGFNICNSRLKNNIENI